MAKRDMDGLEIFQNSYYDTSKATKYGWTPILIQKESITKAICEIGSIYKKIFKNKFHERI